MRRAALLRLVYACAACALAAAAGGHSSGGPAAPAPPGVPRPPPATSSDGVYDRGTRFGGLPPLVFVGLCASVGLASCAIAQALRRRCAVNAASAAAANRAHTQRMVEMLAEARETHAFRLPPVRGMPLAIPWPPVQGTPAYEAFGGEVPPGYEEETRHLRARVIRADRWETNVAFRLLARASCCAAPLHTAHGATATQMTCLVAPPWRLALAVAWLCAAPLAAASPTSSVGDSGSQGHSEAPFKLLSTTPGSGNGADDGKVTATPWDIVVLTLGCSVGFLCCAFGIRRLLLQSAKEAAAMEAALAALSADRAAADAAEAAPAAGDAAQRRGHSRDRRAARAAAGDRQLPQLPSQRGRRAGSAAGSAAGRIPAWCDDDDAALAASEAADTELVPMYTFTPESRADGEWFVAPLAHLPADRPRSDAGGADVEAGRRPRRERRRQDAPQSQPPAPQKSIWGLPGWG